MAGKTQGAERPLSPHIQVYRWQVTAMLMSITHRAAGMALSAGTLLLAWWLIAAAAGPQTYAGFQAAAGSAVGQLVLFGFTWALFYHMLNGIRHLAWDIGYGFSLRNAGISGWAVLVLSAVFTVLLWAYAWSGPGGAA